MGNLPAYGERLCPRVVESQGATEPDTVVDAVRVMRSLRGLSGHRFISDDVSITDPDVPGLTGYRQVSDAHLLTLARRRRTRLVTFDAAIVAFAGRADIELLTP